MGVGIEFDTKNSCRKYQVCKPVAPRKTSIEAILLRFFLYIFFSESFFPLISFFVHQMACFVDNPFSYDAFVHQKATFVDKSRTMQVE